MLSRLQEPKTEKTSFKYDTELDKAIIFHHSCTIYTVFMLSRCQEPKALKTSSKHDAEQDIVQARR